MDILIATLVVGVIGLVLGVALVAAGRKFHVDTDPREAEIRDLLPGNNCGACGYAGCDAVAAAIARGEAPANACPVCSSEKVEQIAVVMGVEAQAAERRIAFVRCGGDCKKTAVTSEYVGVTDCRAAALAGGLGRGGTARLGRGRGLFAAAVAAGGQAERHDGGQHQCQKLFHFHLSSLLF